MNQKLFQTLLATLYPHTLAQMVVDLEEAQEDWRYYPENAPPEEVGKELLDALRLVRNTGVEQARAEGIDFDRLVEQILDARDRADWTQERNRQVRENWLKDLE